MLEKQEEPYAVMRAAQKDLLLSLADQLHLSAVPTTVSEDGLTIYNTDDSLTSISIQAC